MSCDKDSVKPPRTPIFEPMKPIPFSPPRIDDKTIDAVVEVLKDDSQESLTNRVLMREHILYPWVVQRVMSKDITLEERTVRYSSLASQEAREHGFSLHLTGETP